MFSQAYRNRKVLITGHSGFKGSWLAHWLCKLSADVVGLSLPKEADPSHFDLLQMDLRDHRGDIRNLDVVSNIVQTHQPEIVFHLAAQPLVRKSYSDPLETWSTNTMGTANVLEACRRVESVRAIVVITTDKCYHNKEHLWGYRETDPLGGYDPYSASKAAAELVVASFRQSFFSQPGMALVASARAGNVIGGGDWSLDRLIPDAVRACNEHRSLEIRSPHSTRPWQHVLDSLSGYLLLGAKLLAGEKSFAEAWNFGPGAEGNRTVSSVLEAMQQHWPELSWHLASLPQPHEATLLQLDCTKARHLLGWTPVWSLETTVQMTVDWYRQYYEKSTVQTLQQLDRYIADAESMNQSWAKL